MHPEFVCQCCAFKLQRWKKKDNKSQKADLNITLKDYKAHSENCTLCTENNVSSAGEQSGSTEKSTIILTNGKQFGWLFGWFLDGWQYMLQYSGRYLWNMPQEAHVCKPKKSMETNSWHVFATFPSATEIMASSQMKNMISCRRISSLKTSFISVRLQLRQ